MDPVLRARLHLRRDGRLALFGVRAVLNAADAVSRVTVGKPFFGLRECEELLDRVAGRTGPDLLREIMQMNGGTEIVAHGLDHVPVTGPVVIAATHPTGMFDFVAHAHALLPRRPDLKVVANREVERFLGPEAIVAVEIDKQNRATSARATVAAMQDHLEAGGALLIFGSGRVPRREAGHLVEPDWRSGVTRVSAACGSPIVPAALDAMNSRYYYRARASAQFVSGGNDNVGAMIGSLRYAAEMLDKLGGQFEVRYGAPMPPGADPQAVKARAEGLVPGLYAKAGAAGPSG